MIKISDNGIGMNEDEALLSLERHATSKLREANDLNQITSFGFRGEALPSIASVSQFTLKTRTKDSIEGVEINVTAGKLLSQKACGMPHGTIIDVRNLFTGVPARRKFLKTRTQNPLIFILPYACLPWPIHRLLLSLLIQEKLF